MFLKQEFHNAALAVAALALLSAQPSAAGTKPPGGVKLTLINGWKTVSGASKASASISHGVVTLKGAIKTKGDDGLAFVLPEGFRPAVTAYVPVDMCNATNGRLIVDASGNVTVQAENDFANAQCLTSLDGASFAISSDGFKPLKLKNGWAAYSGGTGTPAARNIDGIVHFEGAMAGGGDSLVFVLPKSMRPANTVYIKLDQFIATNGRLEIEPDGRVYVQAETDFLNAQTFSSLAGATFARDSQGFTPLSLINGWDTYGGSAAPAVKVINGTVHFEGAMRTEGSTAQPFVLPAGFRPSERTYVPVDMCNATNGRLVIESSGDVTVEAETSFNNAQCFTSLDGVSFHL
jgi:hypothetical protein